MQDQAALLLNQTINALAVPLETYLETNIIDATVVTNRELKTASFNELLFNLKFGRSLSPAQACVQVVAWLKKNNRVLTSAEKNLEKELFDTLKRCNPDEYFKARVGLLLQEYKKEAAFDSDLMKVVEKLLWSELPAEKTRQAIQKTVTNDWMMNHEGEPFGKKENKLIEEMGDIYSQAFPAPVKKSSSGSTVSAEVVPSQNNPNIDAGTNGQEQSQSLVQAGTAFFGGVLSAVETKVQKFMSGSSETTSKSSDDQPPISQYTGEIFTFAQMRAAVIKDRRIPSSMPRKEVTTVEEIQKREQKQLEKLSKQHESIAQARMAFINRTESSLQALIRGLPTEKKVGFENIKEKSAAYYSLGVDEKKKKAEIVDSVAKTFLDRVASIVPNVLLTQKYLDGLQARKAAVEKSFAVIAQVEALQRAVRWNSKDDAQVNWAVFETSELQSINPEVTNLTNKDEFVDHIAIIAKSETALTKIGKKLKDLKSEKERILNSGESDDFALQSRSLMSDNEVEVEELTSEKVKVYGDPAAARIKKF